jgi:hypothetical protein
MDHREVLNTMDSQEMQIIHFLILWVPTDLNFHMEAEFDFSKFFLLSLAPGINQNFIAYIFLISG